MQQKMTRMQRYSERERNSVALIHLVINVSLKWNSWIVLSWQILTDRLRFPTYVEGGGGEGRGSAPASYIRFRCLCKMNALFRNIIHAEAHIGEREWLFSQRE